ncbi:NADH-quinone oxidoreductase subunit B family protein [Thermococcus barophilus]|uniref:Membrane bound subgroup 4b [NiFe]-hydrogenase MBH(B)3, subunit Mbh(B)3J n=1 Tax=Thermococcus barophilus TaxID=55802 RepID=A0A0S1XD13_THEBA|nr:hydrogenase [Thermococcus barophilus]ALM75668.1 Membrane bound subgroup 4b [NiFe]-hydrogenase MBH(b)3, subunit Mbh(b)3J [Thermococcus barophilus]
MIKSIWVFHLNTGACNGCDIEVIDLLTPFYDVERLGIKLVGSPRHAHAMLVTGPLTRQAYYGAKEAIRAMPPQPRIIVAIGTCACSGGIFYNGYPLYRRPESGRIGKEYPRLGGIDELLKDLRDEGENVGPVVYIPGCPPRPEEIIYGIAQLVGLVERRLSYEEYSDQIVKFKLPEGPVEERIRLTLLERLRHLVGYFDRDEILSEFLKLVEKAEKSENPREELAKLVFEYCQKCRDLRLAYVMKVLEDEYWRIRDAISAGQEFIYWI